MYHNIFVKKVIVLEKKCIMEFGVSYFETNFVSHRLLKNVYNEPWGVHLRSKSDRMRDGTKGSIISSVEVP